MSDVQAVTDPIVYHGEGPVWDARQRRLLYVDMFAGDLMSLSLEDEKVTRRHYGSILAAVRPRKDGGLVLALERRFATVDASGEDLSLLPELWVDASIRMNDGDCDPQGRFYCGSMAYDLSAGRGRLYCLNALLQLDVVIEGVTISNGLAWSPSGERAYYVDSTTQRIDSFQFDGETGRLYGRTCVVEIPRESGMPDGLTVDADGGIWIALYGGAAVRRYLPGGTLDLIVSLPVTQVTSCAFGGDALNELYITTSREGLGRGEQPEAGSVYKARPGVVGQATRVFGG